jgi:ketosteroid isomerase-like protein
MQQAHSHILEAIRKEASKPVELPKPAAPGPSAGKTAADPHDTVEAAQKAIYAVPEQYKAAMEGKDLALLKNIWPALSAQQELAFRNQWAYTRTLRITPQASNIEMLEGDSAIVSVRLHYEQEINDGTSRKWDQKAIFSLGRRGRSWVIESARFEALR